MVQTMSQQRNLREVIMLRTIKKASQSPAPLSVRALAESLRKFMRPPTVGAVVNERSTTVARGERTWSVGSHWNDVIYFSSSEQFTAGKLSVLRCERSAFELS